MQNWLSWQVITMVAVSGMVGASLGVVFTSLIAMKNMEALAQENYRREGRIQLLEFFVQQRTARDVASLTHSLDAATPPAPAPSAGSPNSTSGPRSAAATPTATPSPSTSGQRPAGTASAPPKDPPRAPADTRAPQPAPTAAAAAPAKSAAVLPQGAPNAAPAPVAVTGSPITGEELIEARRNSKTEGVPAEKAGVRGLERDVVLLKNGNTVRVGGHFPSGEKLLQVDPENGLVVTNQRQLLLFFPAPAGGQAPTTQPKGSHEHARQ